jgi:AbrB family looped-hinge helix DNA binding protein
MRVTTKGQVTIPQEIREQLNIRPGAEVEFGVEGDTVTIRRTKGASTRGAGIVQRMSGKGTIRMTTDEILALTRGDA